jgi:hypothetical protein
VLYKHIIHLQNHGTSICLYDFKKYPKIIWQSSHLSFKKCTMRTKVSTLALDIPRSNS